MHTKLKKSYACITNYKLILAQKQNTLLPFYIEGRVFRIK